MSVENSLGTASSSLPSDFVDRLSDLAIFSHDRNHVSVILERLIATDTNRWRSDWITELFPGIADRDRHDLMQRIATAPPTPRHSFHPSRLATLRELLAQADLDAFIVPQADEHLGEFIAARNQRLAWLTGFSGSAGTAVIGRDHAWLFVDGRYIEQAKLEIDASFIEARHFQKPPLWQFMAEALHAGARLGYDPLLHAVAELERMATELTKSGIELVAVDRNPIDALWTDRPAAAFSPVSEHPPEFSGRSMQDKLDTIAVTLNARNLDAVALNQLDSIAWLCNLRGGDVANTPVAECFCVVFSDGHTDLFIESDKLVPQAMRHLGNRVSVKSVSELEASLVAMGRREIVIGLDSSTASGWMKSVLEGAGGTVRAFADPTMFERVRKNAGEIANLRDAMVRDGVCLTRFLKWLKELRPDALPSELEIVEALEHFRSSDPLYRGPSFPAIVGVGPNGAIVHYHSQPETDRRLQPGELVLIDSGGQFLTGTTDITRTLVHSHPSDDQRRIYTAVLKAHIALGSARYPQGTVGAQLDAQARAPLWQVGVNYDHGTGHGIGAFLGVHEGPVRIAPGASIALEPNMLLSNEPGAYLPGRFGIRLENSVIVVSAGNGETGDDFLAFETLSFAPFDRELIDEERLTSDERRWLDDYHAQVFETLAPALSDDERAWLKNETRGV